MNVDVPRARVREGIGDLDAGRFRRAQRFTHAGLEEELRQDLFAPRGAIVPEVDHAVDQRGDGGRGALDLREEHFDRGANLLGAGGRGNGPHRRVQGAERTAYVVDQHLHRAREHHLAL